MRLGFFATFLGQAKKWKYLFAEHHSSQLKTNHFFSTIRELIISSIIKVDRIKRLR